MEVKITFKSLEKKYFSWKVWKTTSSCIVQTLGLLEQGFLLAGCPSCHPTISVKALKGTQSTDP